MRLHCCIFFLLIAVSCLAQVRRDFDVIYDAFNADITNTNLWDATRLGVRNNHSNSYAGIGESGIYSEHLGDFEFLYFQSGDSLFYRGYTYGRGEGLLNDSLTIALKRPFVCGKRLGSFIQRGTRGNTRLEAMTEFESEVAGCGRFVRGVADTLSNVFLVKEKHIIREFLSESGVCINDYMLEFYRWYTEPDSLPLAVQFSMSDENFSDGALYVSEYAAASVLDETEDADIARLLSDALVTQNGSEIEVRFDSEMEVEVEIWLVDSSGHSYGHACHKIGEASPTVLIPVSALPRGAYMLVISSVDGLSVTEKRMLTL